MSEVKIVRVQANYDNNIFDLINEEMKKQSSDGWEYLEAIHKEGDSETWESYGLVFRRREVKGKEAVSFHDVVKMMAGVIDGTSPLVEKKIGVR